MRLWNSHPFKNYWNELSVDKRSEYVQSAKLAKITKNLRWEDIETHHQATLRDVLRGEID